MRDSVKIPFSGVTLMRKYPITEPYSPWKATEIEMLWYRSQFQTPLSNTREIQLHNSKVSCWRSSGEGNIHRFDHLWWGQSASTSIGVWLKDCFYEKLQSDTGIEKKMSQIGQWLWDFIKFPSIAQNYLTAVVHYKCSTTTHPCQWKEMYAWIM